MTADDLVTVPFSGNRFTGLLLVEACRAEGIEVQLLADDAGGLYPGLELSHPHRLLVREADRERVEEIIARELEEE